MASYVSSNTESPLSLELVLATRLPTVIAGSYSYIIPIISIVQAKRYDLYTDPYEIFTQTKRDSKCLDRKCIFPDASSSGTSPSMVQLSSNGGLHSLLPTKSDASKLCN
ncbi:hypothetical protein Ahy_A07g031515 [Arachis hypogaea]|uniref:Uncharacterized protein n=1 Tax=Arachis hypogaea TaxID=3818 RepID=A0A445C463_ARAHY|nr:hypothetical protein Ahy_A07g031515 [Arachis hypogaea]